MQGLTNKGRLEALRRTNQKLERLIRLTADIARLGDERVTLKKIVDTAASLMGVQGAHLVQRHPLRRDAVHPPFRLGKQREGTRGLGLHPVGDRRDADSLQQLSDVPV